MGSKASFILLNGKYMLCIDGDCSNIEEREREGKEFLLVRECIPRLYTI